MLSTSSPASISSERSWAGPGAEPRVADFRKPVALPAIPFDEAPSVAAAARLDGHAARNYHDDLALGGALRVQTLRRCHKGIFAASGKSRATTDNQGRVKQTGHKPLRNQGHRSSSTMRSASCGAIMPAASIAAERASQPNRTCAIRSKPRFTREAVMRQFQDTQASCLTQPPGWPMSVWIFARHHFADASNAPAIRRWPLIDKPGADSIRLAEARSEADILACLPVLRELRRYIGQAEDFVGQIRRLRRHQGYRLLAAWQDDRVVACAGFGVRENS